MSRTIGTILTLKDKMSSPLTKVSDNVKKVTREMKRSQNQIEKWRRNGMKAIDNVVKKMAKFAIAAGAMIGGLVFTIGIRGVAELEEAAAKVKSIAGESLSLQSIQEDLLKQSTRLGVSVKELADTQYQAISSGIDAADSMQASIQAAKLAKAGFTDSASALNLMASTMNVFGMEGEAALTKVSDKMLMTQNLGVLTVAELSESLGQVTPIAKAAGLSLDETLTSVALLTKNGLSSSEAMTALKGVMTSVIKPTKEASDMAAQLGIDFSVGAIEAKGFGNWLEEIKEKTGGSTEELGQLFGNVRALNGILTLTGDGFEEFDEILNQVKNSTGSTDEAFEIMTNTLGFKFEKLKNTGKNFLTQIMQTQSGLIGEYIDNLNTWVSENEDKIQDWVTAAGEGISKIVDFIKSVIDFVKKHEKAITTLLVFAATIYGVLKAVALFKTALEILTVVAFAADGAFKFTALGKVTLIIAAVVAAGYLLYRNWDLIKEKAAELGINFDWIREKLNQFKDAAIFVKDKLIELKDWIVDLGSTLIDFGIDAVDTVREKFSDFKDMLIENEDAIKTVATVLGVIFGPALIKTGIQAVIAGTQILVSFIGSLIKTGIQAVITAAQIVGTLVLAFLKTGAKAIWASIQIGVGFVLSLIKTTVQIGITAAALTGQLIVAMINYAVSGWQAVASITAATTAWIIQKGAIVASTVASGAMTAAQWAMNAAMNANPIGILITLIGGLILGLIALWKNSDRAREMMTNAFNKIRDTVQGAVDKILGLWNGLKEALSKPVNAVVNIFKRDKGGDVDGSHKTGLERVPWDGYVAELHKGETVLTKQEADEYHGKNGSKIKSSGNSGSNSNDGTPPINIHIHGNVYGNDELTNHIGSEICKKVKIALMNS